jgi:hypothetical protein
MPKEPLMVNERPKTDPASPEATSLFVGSDSPVPDGLELTPVTSHGWRVTDGRLPVHDPLRLLGYIERRGDVFDVMQLGAGFEWNEFPSLVAAVEYLCRTGVGVARARPSGDLAWIA